MASLVLASFLAGSIITLLIPVGLLIGLAVWYTIAVRRLSDVESKRAPDGPAEPSRDDTATHP
jgi:uncharacterized membrane protein YhaH (DUF805 family)